MPNLSNRPERPKPAEGKVSVPRYSITAGLVVAAGVIGFVLYLWTRPPEFVTPTDLVQFWAMVGGFGGAVTALLTLALLVVAIIGLRSLGIAQTDMVNRARRDARSCSIDRCREFADDIIVRSLDVRLKLPLFVKSEKDVVFDGEKETVQVKAATDWVNKTPIETLNKCIGLLNRMESWAMYFTQGLADASLAYQPCSPVYLSIVLQQYPLLVYLRAQSGSGRFPNTVQLFEAWFVAKNSHEQAENLKKMAQAMQELREAGERASLKPPLGTEG